MRILPGSSATASAPIRKVLSAIPCEKSSENMMERANTAPPAMRVASISASQFFMKSRNDFTGNANASTSPASSFAGKSSSKVSSPAPTAAYTAPPSAKRRILSFCGRIESNAAVRCKTKRFIRRLSSKKSSMYMETALLRSFSFNRKVIVSLLP